MFEIFVEFATYFAEAYLFIVGTWLIAKGTTYAISALKGASE